MGQTLEALDKNAAKLQSRLLVLAVGGVLLLTFLAPLPFLAKHPGSLSLFVTSCMLSLTFGALVWALRAATPAAAFFGAVICQIVTVWTWNARYGYAHTALTPLMLLFVLTFLATRAGKRQRPEFTGAREARRGRSASQIIANLGAAALFAFTPAALLAALAEATADTVSSEIGQAFGGTPFLVTTLRQVPPGTDGGISALGTLAGLFGAALVTAAGAWALRLSPHQGLLALAGAVAGLFFDSLLGATVERRGWLNNDLVNFSSTLLAAACTLLLLLL